MYLNHFRRLISSTTGSVLSDERYEISNTTDSISRYKWWFCCFCWWWLHLLESLYVGDNLLNTARFPLTLLTITDKYNWCWYIVSLDGPISEPLHLLLLVFTATNILGTIIYLLPNKYHIHCWFIKSYCKWAVL
jgi:hypothetical protein